MSGDSFESYMADWIERRSTQVEHNRELLQRRSMTCHCYSQSQGETEVKKELSNIYTQFITDHAGGVNYGKFIKDWVLPLNRSIVPQVIGGSDLYVYENPIKVKSKDWLNVVPNEEEEKRIEDCFTN